MTPHSKDVKTDIKEMVLHGIKKFFYSQDNETFLLSVQDNINIIFSDKNGYRNGVFKFVKVIIYLESNEKFCV